MEILVAREELNSKPKKTTFEKLEQILSKKGEEIFYFDRDNSHKTMIELDDKFQSKGYNTHLREVKYGLADEEYIYEMHIL